MAEPTCRTLSKRYWLFGGSNHYPEGGASDFIWWFDTLEEADEVAIARGLDDELHFWNVLDTEKMTVYVRRESKQ